MPSNFAVTFHSVEHLREEFASNIVGGRFFVRAYRPVMLWDMINIEFRMADAVGSVSVQAEVVERVPATRAGGRSGFWANLLDLDEIKLAHLEYWLRPHQEDTFLVTEKSKDSDSEHSRLQTLLQEGRVPTSGNMAGTLKGFGVSTLVSLICETRKQGKIRIVHGSEAGQVEIIDGQIVKAKMETNDDTPFPPPPAYNPINDEALSNMMNWDAVEFVFLSKEKQNK